jgi:hypothetical protein
MIPQEVGTDYPPFLKSAELKKNVIVTIKTEFAPPTNTKISSFLIGNVDMGGVLYTLGINPSTYRNIAKDYGTDTAGWIDKDIKFLGMQKLGKGNGYLWSAITQ